MSFLEQGAKFLLPNNLIYLEILKIFYKKTKNFQSKEDIYNLCKKLDKFKEMKKQNFDNYIENLYIWGNLERTENQLYRITENTIILLKALEKIENINN